MNLKRLCKRWYDMLLGKSAFNVQQGKGAFYTREEIKGYYNDLTNKVDAKMDFDDRGIPLSTTVANVTAYFPITIFQYGLGLYDRYLQTGTEDYKKKFINIADWALEQIKEDGMWECMSNLKDKAHETQSSMCQGEGISVLARAYAETKKEEYKIAALKAADFMLKDIKDGGTADEDETKLVFQEYVSKYNLSVLNGWIFSLFGLYDAYLLTDKKKYKDKIEKTVKTMKFKLKEYDRGYWSSYDAKGTIASPAYHHLHIELLKIMSDLFEEKIFKEYADKFINYENKKTNRLLAITIKAKQKLLPNDYYDIDTSLVS